MQRLPAKARYTAAFCFRSSALCNPGSSLLTKIMGVDTCAVSASSL
jgi:hypothetical protein